MDPSKAMIVAGITIAVVVLVNVAIFFWAARRDPRRDQSVGQIELLRRATGRARDPWHDENSDLEELSRIVAELKKKKEG